MARHLLIGTAGAATIDGTTHLVPDGGIVFQAEDNLVFHASAETVLLSPSFRVMQGTAGANIVSPWIRGNNIISITGTKNVPAVAHTATVTATTNSTATGFVNLKFVRKGGTPEFFHLNTEVSTAVTTADNIGIAIFTAYNAAVKPDWLAAACTEADAVVTFSGAKNSASFSEGLVAFDVIVAENTVGTSTFPIVNDVAAAMSGSGVGYDILKLEEELQGINNGYYNRVKLPNAPALVAQGAAFYDIITIVATKDGSTSSSINGVDNLIQIDIAMKELGADTVIVALQTALNGYAESIGFADIDAKA